jgi:hypothetical protein
VGLGVEIGGAQDLDDARECLAPFQEHGAEHRALRVQVVGRDPRRYFDGTHGRVLPHVNIMRPDVERAGSIRSRKIFENASVVRKRWIRGGYRVKMT